MRDGAMAVRRPLSLLPCSQALIDTVELSHFVGIRVHTESNAHKWLRESSIASRSPTSVACTVSLWPVSAYLHASPYLDGLLTHTQV